MRETDHGRHCEKRSDEQSVSHPVVREHGDSYTDWTKATAKSDAEVEASIIAGIRRGAATATLTPPVKS